jgi:hypothetical protein
MNEMKDRWGVAIVAVLGLVALTLLLPTTLTMVVRSQPTQDVYIPIVAVTGLLVLLIALGLMTLSVAALNLSDRTQALGLPDGSIRAVIALGLIILFAVISVFLYTSISNRKALAQITAFPADRVQEFQKLIPGAISVPTKDNTVSIYYSDPQTAAGDDFAKQLMVLLGTLVTSVSSFYFGSKVAASAATSAAASVAAAAIAPAGTSAATPAATAPAGAANAVLSLREVSPASIPRNTPVDLTLSGKNLDLIKEVKLVQGGKQIVCTNLAPGATVVKCSISVPSEFSAGAADIVISDGVGQQTRLVAALTLT